jgi:hypothetical protein
VSECKIMSTLRHPHIVQFFWCVLSSWGKSSFSCHRASGNRPS